ncbi:hypothetical protein [Alteromonas flava]|uniref:hypothetical protein n=1 Tax=Alteromonas flava TaxID=2048003 RepID=UPI000C283707|nr:hypothetical protein [Alteromonas flava]
MSISLNNIRPVKFRITAGLIGISLFLLTASRLSVAAEMSFSGFATLGLTYEGHNELAYRNTLINAVHDGVSFPADSVLGGQVNVEFNDHWEAVGQIVIQDRADTAFSNYIEKAFVRYNVDRNLAIRVGRMDSNLFMLSDYRQVGYAYPWARPPIDFYSASSIIASIEGIDVYYSFDVLGGFMKAGMLVGETQARLNGDSGRLRVDFKDAVATIVEFQKGYWLLKIAHAVGETDNFEFVGFEEFRDAFDFVPEVLWPEASSVIDGIDPDGDRVSYTSLGLKYDDFTWQVQAEAAYFNSDWTLYPAATFGYLSIGRYFDRFLPYVSVSGYRPDDPVTRINAPQLPPNIPAELAFTINALATLGDGATTDAYVDQTTLTVGLRWDFADAWALKFQADHVRIKEFGSGLWGNDALATFSQPQTLNVIHLGVSTVF